MLSTLSLELEEVSSMALLEVRNLHTDFPVKGGTVHAVNGVSFNLERGEVLGIVGESGSGKSITSYSIMQILSEPGKITSGSIKFDGVELVGMSEHELRKIRGDRISIIFQDPMTSLNPVFKIGNQLIEAICLHTDRTKEEAYNKAIELLTLVGINEPEKRMKQYPHQLSGGMRQRIMIAMALGAEPDLLIADEPTTALDVTIQAQILELMKSLQKKFNMAIILITHDLGVVAGMCDRINVMYAGNIVETGKTDEIFYNPKHEYTKGLIKSIPNPSDDDNTRLEPIPGTPVDMLALPDGCSFVPRCVNCMKICLNNKPEYEEFEEGHRAACFMNLYEQYKKEIKENK